MNEPTNIPGAPGWVPAYELPVTRSAPLRALPDDLPAFAAGDPVRVSEPVAGTGVVVGEHPTWHGFYVVRLDTPAWVARERGAPDGVAEAWCPADRMEYVAP